MLKKYYIAFFLLMYSIPAYSSVWDDFTACVTDLCNCGTPPKSEERWNGTVKRTHVKLNRICAPWRKEEGRTTDNCLMQYEMPQPGIGFYLQYCAQKTPDSTYFNPKIHIRTASCNAFACWSESTTLRWNGECVVWPGAYGIPLLRICARVAMPEVPAGALNTKEIPADDGYDTFPGKHLNMVGHLDDDERDADGNLFDKPKLCAYVDPGLVNLISAEGFSHDLLDTNPNSQPLHKTTKLHPIMQVLLFLFKYAIGNLPEMLSDLLESLGAEKIPGLDVLHLILKQIGKLLNLMKSVVEEILTRCGSLNGDVGKSLGCVEIPLGPFPPPYCPTLKYIMPTSTISTICSKKNLDGKFSQNSQDACVVSRLPNNIIQNVVRISIDNLVPLCKRGQSPTKDPCVTINSSTPNAKDIHNQTNQFDTIKPCTAMSGALCVDTTIPLKCSVTAPDTGCQDGFRIVYGQKIGKITKPYDYYVDDLDDCGTSRAPGQTACQEIWGINTGEFIDVPITFTDDVTDTLSPLTRDVKLTDNHSLDSPLLRKFQAKIAQYPAPDSEDRTPLDPKSICVTEEDNLVGCVKRVLDGYVLKVSLCPPGYLCAPNNLNYFTPKFIAELQVLDKDGKVINSLQKTVAPLTIRNSPKLKLGEPIPSTQLAGLNFSPFMAFISDDGSDYIAMPFSDSNALNPFSRFGKYKDRKVPYDFKIQRFIPGAVYLSGLEYNNSMYIQGGTLACLQPLDMVKCTPGVAHSEANCVLTKLIETDIVDCHKFITETRPLYPNLRICQPDQEEGKNKGGCTVVKTIDGEKRSNGITIYKCKDSVSCYENNVKPGEEVCKISLAVKDRIVPEASLGLPINKEDQHFILTADQDGNPNYDNKTTAIRDKTLLELGLCVKYPIPKCAAITTPSNTSGNATWPETEIGEVATGTCQSGFASDSPLQRYCLSKVEDQRIEFEPLVGTGCKARSSVKEPNFSLTTIGFQQDLPHKEVYDSVTKIGTISLGDHNNTPTVQFFTAQNCINYEFNTNNKDLAYFTIGANSHNPFYVPKLKVTVNNIVVPLDQVQDTLKDLITHGGRTLVERDIRRYLRAQNNIKICIEAGGNKNVTINMIFKFK